MMFSFAWRCSSLTQALALSSDDYIAHISRSTTRASLDCHLPRGKGKASMNPITLRASGKKDEEMETEQGNLRLG